MIDLFQWNLVGRRRKTLKEEENWRDLQNAIIAYKKEIVMKNWWNGQ